LSLPQTTQLQVPSSLDALANVLSWFDQLYQSFIPKSAWIRCQLALAEGFTNAVRHAHKGRSSDLYIDLEVTILERQIEIRIWDFGEPFDLVKKIKDILAKTKDKSTDINSLSCGGGGRGLLLMSDIGDYLSYEHGEDGRNCLLIIKQF
jgi:serine/threonine-protein kinase RsbW